jgi:hypothetical protein
VIHDIKRIGRSNSEELNHDIAMVAEFIDDAVLLNGFD